MKKQHRDFILEKTNATKLIEIEKIQDLWSGYGTIKRYKLIGSEIKSLVIKHVEIPNQSTHPRGWSGSLSNKRKIKSYQVETAWYQNWSKQLSKNCYTAKYYGSISSNENDFFLILLEDLNQSGFSNKKSSLTIAEVKICLKWLAHFHATFLGEAPTSLWEQGTYWHLETRPDELAALKDKNLKNAATQIDELLNATSFLTFVHGDAKPANFCFSKDSKKVAAVDFQYVGGGCGMKDVAYLLGSSLSEEECEKYEQELLSYYFDVIKNIISSKKPKIDIDSLELSWRKLFPVAWADFHRFIKGWSPEHWKINSYSEKTTQKVINSLSEFS